MSVSGFAENPNIGESQLPISTESVEVKTNPNTDPTGNEVAKEYNDFNVSPLASRSEQEINDTRAAADFMSIGDTMRGTISSVSDTDCFYFKPSQAQTVTIKMTGPASSSYDYDLWLQNSTGSALASATASGSSGAISYKVSGGISYYIVVNSAKGFGQSYSVSLTGTSTGVSGPLNITRFPQDDTLWCWATAVQMIGNFETSIKKSQSSIVTQIKGSPVNQTGSMAEQVRALKWYDSSKFANADYWAANTLQYFDTYVTSNFNKGHATSLACTTQSGDKGHSFVVKDINGSTVELIDPWKTTSNKRVSKDQLTRTGITSPAVLGDLYAAACTIY